MLEHERTLTRDEQQEFLRCLERSRHLLEVQNERSARGRQILWDKFKVDLRPRVVAVQRQERRELTDLLERVVGDYDVALAYVYEPGRGTGIRPHKDAAFAGKIARMVNLAPAVFRIWIENGAPPPIGVDAKPAEKRIKPGDKPAKFTEYRVKLTGGEVLRFNCKLLHTSETEEKLRWAIALWKFSPKWASATPE